MTHLALEAFRTYQDLCNRDMMSRHAALVNLLVAKEIISFDEFETERMRVFTAMMDKGGTGAQGVQGAKEEEKIP